MCGQCVLGLLPHVCSVYTYPVSINIRPLEAINCHPLWFAIFKHTDHVSLQITLMLVLAAEQLAQCFFAVRNY